MPIWKRRKQMEQISGDNLLQSKSFTVDSFPHLFAPTFKWAFREMGGWRKLSPIQILYYRQFSPPICPQHSSNGPFRKVGKVGVGWRKLSSGQISYCRQFSPPALSASKMINLHPKLPSNLFILYWNPANSHSFANHDLKSRLKPETYDTIKFDQNLKEIALHAAYKMKWERDEKRIEGVTFTWSLSFWSFAPRTCFESSEWGNEAAAEIE